MESQIKVHATREEMSRLFNEGEDWRVYGMNIRYLEEIRHGLWKLIVRHQECGHPIGGRTFKSFESFAASIKRGTDKH